MVLNIVNCQAFSYPMKFLKIFVFFTFLTACNSDDVGNECNFLINVNVDVQINLNLPQFDALNFPSGVVYLPGEGNGGIYLINIGQTILAWDGADPNFPLSSCSIMTLEGINVSSSCEGGNEFNLFSGQPIGDNIPPCGLKPYRVLPLDSSTYVISN
jgi:hypothetical protein